MKKYAIIPLFTLLLACGNEKSLPYHQVSGFTQGTTYSITYAGNESVSQEALDSIFRNFDLSLSLWVENSILSRWNRGDTSVKTDHYFETVFEISHRIHNQTDGAFNPAVFPLVQFWGFGPAGATLPDTPDSIEIQKILSRTIFPPIHTLANHRLPKTLAGQALDFNGIAQGYSVDVIAEYLNDLNIEHYMIEIGGEIRTKGNNRSGEPWNIGIDKPDFHQESRELMAIAKVQGAIATSGSYRKFYEKEGVKYSHTIDPRSGYPVTHSLLSVTVWAPTCAEADGFATAFLVLGTHKTIELAAQWPNINVFLVFSDAAGNLQTYWSPELANQLQLMNE